jgi:REP element-mobilizing transposase RayT
MARPLRIEYPEAIYHITARGNEKRAIWRYDNDYITFLTYLIEGVKSFRLRLFAYMFMPNHYHLLLQTLDANLTKAMHQLNTAYTVYFNRKYKRVGHLFQGRYRAILVQKNPYLLEVSRYVHLNAVRAGLVDNPFRYRWSSCQYYSTRATTPAWLEVDYILEMMANSPQKRRSEYRKFLEDGMVNRKNPFDKIHAQTVLGDEDFFDSVCRKLESKENQEIPATKQLIKKLSFDDIIGTVSKIMQKDRKQIIEGGRFSLARKITIYLLRTRSDMSLNEIGTHFGISYAAVTQTKKALDHQIQHDASLKSLIGEIDELLES